MTAGLRLGLFAVACVGQVVAVAGGIVTHERTLASGAVYRFATAPVDPVDPFRGRYVALAYEAERAEVPAPPEALEGGLAYAVLETAPDGFARVREIRMDRPLAGDYLRVHVEGSYDRITQIDLPFDRYYAEESEAQRIERAFRPRPPGEGPPAERSHAVVRVRDGHGVIESLVVNGEVAPRGAAPSR